MMRVLCGIAVAITASSCEKKDAPAASGALSAAEAPLFQALPAGNQLVFGGSYAKLQDFMQRTALGRASRDAAEQLGGNSMATWLSCISNMTSLRFAGGLRFAGEHGAELRMLTAGAGLDDFRTCATKASLTATVDPDNKFLRVELPGPAGGDPIAQSYLVVGDRQLYTRGTFSVAGGLSVASATRADLEADAAATKQSNAANDPATASVIAKVDRSKTVWFAGNAAGTPIAGKLGELYGSLDVGSGVALDVIVQFTDPQLQSQIEDNVDQVKRHADQAPSKEMRELVDNLSAKRIADRTRFTLAVSDAQLEALMSMGGGMFGGM